MKLTRNTPTIYAVISATLAANGLPNDRKTVGKVFHAYMVTDTVEIDVLTAVAHVFGGTSEDYDFEPAKNPVKVLVDTGNLVDSNTRRPYK